ncbi:cytochrome P450, partial [Trifolium medium]|nr:cytochrome P450 [Trifolium medium]
GFNPGFYQHFWDLCGHEVFEVSCTWLESGVFPPNILDVEIGEAVGFPRALRWVDELQLRDMDVEMDCKSVVDGLYSHRAYTSDLGAILNDYKLILVL